MKRDSPVTVAETRRAALPPPPQRRKKTRELPNLSDCHCCKRRINSTNPKNRLRPLASEWRIVLLCKSCHNLVESSQICSYCLTEVSSSSMDSFYECKRCRRRIHRSCVSRFNFGTGNYDDFSVCFDCWVPKLLENYYNSVSGGRVWRKVKVSGDLNPLGSSRVCDSQSKENVGVQKKIAVAVEEENAFMKPAVARRVAELASGGGSTIDEDAQLAIQLHRAMNSSPRSARNSCILNDNCVDVTELNANGNLDTFRQQAAIETRAFCKLTMDADDVNGMDTDPLSNRGLNGRFTEAKPDCLRKSNEAEDEKCNGDSNGYWITYSRRGQGSQNGRSKKDSDGFLRMYSRRLLHVERGKPDHRVKTYKQEALRNVMLQKQITIWKCRT